MFYLFLKRKNTRIFQNFHETVIYVKQIWLMNTCAKFEVDIFKNGCARAFYIYMFKTITFTSFLEFQKKNCSILKIQKRFG